jgi:ABC-type uncharacterized transport system substrate-binding protein
MSTTRRQFCSLIGCAALWPRAAATQSPELPVIGFLHTATIESYVADAAAFADGLKELGFAEAQNLAIDYRFAKGLRELLPMLAAELVKQPVAAIVAGGASAARAAKAATTTIPIVMVSGSDPVRLGLVASLERPGGNVTGVTIKTHGLAATGLARLRELVPGATVIGYLGEDPKGTTLGDLAPEIEARRDEVTAAARALGWQVAVAEVGYDRNYEAAFASLAEHRIAALVIAPSAVLASDIDEIASFAARYEMPTLFVRRSDVISGGVMSFGASTRDAWRAAGTQVGRVLRGAAPATLPVVETASPELAINLPIARTFNLTVPPSLRADAEAIE